MTTSTTTERLTIVCLMRPKPDQAAALRQALLALVEPTRAEVGCWAYDLYEEADGSVLLFESWRSLEELKTHQQQPAIRAVFGERLRGLLAEDMGMHYCAPIWPQGLSSNQEHQLKEEEA